jgi:DNA polymerase
METLTDINALLKFYLEAGVDETIGDKPIDRFEAARNSAVTQKKPISPPSSSIGKPAPPPQPVDLPSLSEAVKIVKELTANCNSIAELSAALNSYDGCNLKKMATSTVFASGNSEAKLMIIDRPPSVAEDRGGIPFAAEAGELLIRMLTAIGLNHEDVYLTSILPWRPPGGRPPTDEELALCLPFVRRHIELANPDFLLLCGEAGGFLSGQKASINKLRGKWVDIQLQEHVVKALPIFHPGFLLDHPASKKYAWADLQKLEAVLEKQV